MDVKLAAPIVLLCLVPDSGHALPLVRMGRFIEEAGIAVTFVCPDEVAALARPHLTQVIEFGAVRPPNYQRSLKRIANSSSSARQLWLNRWFDRVYLEPIQAAVYERRAKLVAILEELRPALVVADDHLFREFCQVLVQHCGSRLILNYSAGTCYRFLMHKPWVKGGQSPGRIMKTAISLAPRVLDTASRIFRPRRFREVAQRRRYLRQEWRRTREQLTIELGAVPHIGCGMAVLEEHYLRERLEPLRKRTSFPPIAPAEGQCIPEDLESWLDAGGKVVYICFGTMAPTRFRFAHRLIRQCLEQGFRVLWASPSSPAQLSRFGAAKVRWEKWVPQVAVLKSSAVIGFVTHAGAGSVQEALWVGKPVISIPLTWDQPYNAWVAQELGFGRQLPKSHLSTEMIRDAVKALHEESALTAAARTLGEEVRLRSRESGLVDFLLSQVLDRRA